jgi:hypothetical protein
MLDPNIRTTFLALARAKTFQPIPSWKQIPNVRSKELMDDANNNKLERIRSNLVSCPSYTPISETSGLL